jgi:RND family efflux transporter MFP subunit
VWVAVLLLGAISEAAAEEALRRTRLLAHLPRVHGLHQRVDRAEVAVGHFASVLELVSSLNEQERFSAAAMALCNELATRHQCGRVSLGWVEGDYVRLRAISHSEKFDRKTETAQALEAAMEEALDQDEVIVWPEPEGQALVTRDHAKFAETQKARFVCSVPVRLEGEGMAVLACERDTQAFAEVELRLLTLCADMSARRLADLKKSDRWFGARWAAAAREKSAVLLGPQHTGAKLLALALALLLAWACFGRMTYRVEAPFTLSTDSAAFVTAPFGGFIDEVKVEVGSEVKKGDVLATLDTRDLLLEEAAALADQTRFLREAEKASAADKVAEMRIAQSQAEQARARLELIQHRRTQSALVAPFDSVVIEGDLKKRIGAPVRQGDVLFKITRLDSMLAECSVPEQDAHELRLGQPGEIAFASNPRDRHAVRVNRIDPIAQPKEGGNVIVVRCALEARRDWWRPGMSGVAKLDAGPRSPGWIAAHRTVDFLRMKFWW